MARRGATASAARLNAAAAMSAATLRPFVVLFICMGNICRSPTAHGVFRNKVQRAGWSPWVVVESAGTHDYHPGEPPDSRTQRHARQRGYDLSDLRARQIADEDFERADLVLAMDGENLVCAARRCPPQHLNKLRRLTDFGRGPAGLDVPDPYHGPAQAFERVLDLVEDACDGLLRHVGSELRARGAALAAH